MPGFTPGPSSSLSITGIWRPFALHSAWWEKVLDLWTYPGSALVSGAVVLAAFVAFRRRGRTRLGAIWLGAWFAANAIELAGKHELDRPSLHWTEHGTRIAIASFQGSFPSGHTIRALLVAALAITFRPSLRLPVLAWFVVAVVALVVVAAHTPSDVLGGLLVGLALVLAVKAAPG
jgi:membrane-associated phospholipid phosphatase